MKNILLTCLVGAACCSCANFLKEYSQDQAYIRSYEDLDELLIGETYMETSFGSSEATYYPYLQLMADETRENNWEKTEPIEYTQYTKKYFGYVTWQYRVGYAIDKLSTSAEDTYWNKIYKHINLANMILDEVEKQEADSETAREAISRIRGEAYFLRGAYYFILANLYCQPYESAKAATTLGIPIKTTHYIEGISFPRGTLDKVYGRVTEDLEKAAENLTGIARKTVYRADITAVRLLQSRVYLYMQNWEKAAEYAQMCLDLQADLEDLNSFDGTEAFATSTSPELIFSMGGNHIPRMLNALFNGVSVSEGLQKCYKTSDLRRMYFITNDTKVAGIWDCNKYVIQESNENADVSENFMLRTAEAWLNLAEASACMGGSQEEAARTALDKLRVNRIKKSGYQPTTLAGDALIQEIREERRRELCFEGHRWFDLRRYMVSEKVPFTGSINNTYSGIDDETMTGSISTYELKAGDPSWTLQIPYEVLEFEELEANPRNERAPVKVERV